MTSRACDMFRLFVILNLVLIWTGIFFIMHDTEQSDASMRLSIAALTKVKHEAGMGPRYTACDAKRHLVYEHGKPEEILNDCLAYPITQIEELRLSGFTY